MTDTVSKVIGVLLAFVLLVLTPMTISRMTDDMAIRRQVLNEVSLFIDKVTDKGSVTAYDVDDILLGVNSFGGTFDVSIVRYTRIAVKDYTMSGEVRSMYCATDEKITALTGNGVVNLNAGDIVQVRVEAIGKTKGQSLIQGLLHVFEKPFAFTLAGMVR